MLVLENGNEKTSTLRAPGTIIIYIYATMPILAIYMEFDVLILCSVYGNKYLRNIPAAESSTITPLLLFPTKPPSLTILTPRPCSGGPNPPGFPYAELVTCTLVSITSWPYVLHTKKAPMDHNSYKARIWPSRSGSRSSPSSKLLSHDQNLLFP